MEVYEKYEKYVDFLRFFNRVHNYSTRNIIRIFSQRPDAKIVASAETWRSAGRFIRKGEKGIKILAPVIGASGKPARYETSYVFDVSQTVGNPIPYYSWDSDAFCNLQSIPALLEALKKVSPCPIFFDEDWKGGKANGFLDLKNKEIHIRTRDRSKEAILRSTMHEVVHARLHQHVAFNRAAKEIQSESITFIVLTHFGYSKKFRLSKEYIEGWAAQQPDTDLRENLYLIGTGAKDLIAALEKELPSD